MRSRNVRMADATCPFDMGARVHDIGDPRFHGVVLAIHHGAFVTVRWEDSGWRSDLRIERVRLSGKEAP